MSFEEKIKEERNAIGMSISGDPLDGLKRYIEKKSMGMAIVKEFLAKLEESIVEEPVISDEVNEAAAEGSTPVKEAE